MAGHVQGRKEDPRDIVRAGLDALDRGEHVTKLLKATVMDTGR